MTAGKLAAPGVAGGTRASLLYTIVEGKEAQAVEVAWGK